MVSGKYDLNIRQFYEDVAETWERWKDKPAKGSYIRLGTLSEPTKHPEFLDILEKIKPCSYMTDGRILGTPGDPRRFDHLEGTINSGSKVILLWSDTTYFRRALRELEGAGVKTVVGIKEERDIKLGDREILFIPENPDLYSPKDLSNEIKILEYYQNILMTDKKIIITKDSTNLKPITVYDRI